MRLGTEVLIVALSNNYNLRYILCLPLMIFGYKNELERKGKTSRMKNYEDVMCKTKI